MTGQVLAGGEKKKILIVDDEPAELRLMENILSASSYEVIPATRGQEAIRIIYELQPDLVLLDVIMPDLDGWQTCLCIREASDIPIIMLTGKRHAEEDVIRGLECGADEYIRKPVGNRELVARVKATLRRAGKTGTGEPAAGGGFADKWLVVDIPEWKVTVNGERVKLTPREFHLLALLVENANKVQTHRQILEHVWGWEYIDDVDYVRIYVSHLRQKIEPDPSQPSYILTEPGVGYRFKGR